MNLVKWYDHHALEEVVIPTPRCNRYRSLIARDCREDVELGLQILAKVHNRCYVSTTVAVVRRRPYSDHGLVLEVPLIPFVYQLVSSSDKL